MKRMAKRLVEIGFTEYEAKAYLALLGLGVASGYQIAKRSQVPRSAIYEVLNKLIVRGAVLTESSGDQVRYSPLPSDQLVERKRREMQGHLDALASGLRGIHERPALPNGAWRVAGRENMLAFAQERVARAEGEVAFFVTGDGTPDALIEPLQEAQERGVTLVVIASLPKDTVNLPAAVYRQGSALRQAVGPGFVLLVDGRELLYGALEGEEGAVWITHRYAVAWTAWCLKQEIARLPPSSG